MLVAAVREGDAPQSSTSSGNELHRHVDLVALLTGVASEESGKVAL